MVGKWLLLLLLVAPAALADKVCGNLVQIPLEISFVEGRYNTEPILRSLEPRLKIGRRALRPKGLEIVDGLVLADFCVAEVVIENATGMIASIGSESHDLALRPIQNRRMTKIRWLHPNPPSWTVVQSSSWSTLADGRPVLDLQLFNYALGEQSAVEFEVVLLGDETPKAGNCFTSSAINVDLELAAGEIQVFAPGATYPEPTRRSAKFFPASCDAPHRMSLGLGPTRPIPAGKASELRFIFSRSELRIPTFDLDVLSLPERRLVFSQNSGVYPRHATVQ